VRQEAAKTANSRGRKSRKIGPAVAVR